MLYPIYLEDADDASSGVAQLIQYTQAHRKRLKGICKYLTAENTHCIKPHSQTASFNIYNAATHFQIAFHTKYNRQVHFTNLETYIRTYICTQQN